MNSPQAHLQIKKKKIKFPTVPSDENATFALEVKENQLKRREKKQKITNLTTTSQEARRQS